MPVSILEAEKTKLFCVFKPNQWALPPRTPDPRRSDWDRGPPVERCRKRKSHFAGGFKILEFVMQESMCCRPELLNHIQAFQLFRLIWAQFLSIRSVKSRATVRPFKLGFTTAASARLRRSFFYCKHRSLILLAQRVHHQQR